MSLSAGSSVADADGFALSGSSFVLPSTSHPSRSSLKLVVLNGMDEVETWSDAVVLMFIQAKILSDLVGLKKNLRCLPLHADAVAVQEKAYWARFIRLKVLAELKLTGVQKPGAYVPLPPLAPFVPLAPFIAPDLSGAGNARETKKLLAEVTELYNLSRVAHDGEVAAITARHVKSCDLHAKEYQNLATNYEIEKESVTSLITSQLLGDARLQLWIQILPPEVLLISRSSIQCRSPTLLSLCSPSSKPFSVTVMVKNYSCKCSFGRLPWQVKEVVILCDFIVMLLLLGGSSRYSMMSPSEIKICVQFSSRAYLMTFSWISRQHFTTTLRVPKR